MMWAEVDLDSGLGDSTYVKPVDLFMPARIVETEDKSQHIVKKGKGQAGRYVLKTASKP